MTKNINDSDKIKAQAQKHAEAITALKAKHETKVAALAASQQRNVEKLTAAFDRHNKRVAGLVAKAKTAVAAVASAVNNGTAQAKLNKLLEAAAKAVDALAVGLAKTKGGKDDDGRGTTAI